MQGLNMYVQKEKKNRKNIKEYNMGKNKKKITKRYVSMRTKIVNEKFGKQQQIPEKRK